MKFNVQRYMARGVRRVAKEAIFATSENQKESGFVKSFAFSAARATKLRLKQERAGFHVPPFLIASITSNCNLHCAGCYSRSNKATVDCAPTGQLTAREWKDIFEQAEVLGISFILLAGGEPMLRRDVLQAAGEIPDILFPIFTNGTFLTNAYVGLFDECRNLIPVMSIEGDREQTDARRGNGIYDRQMENMDVLRRKGIVFGASITVTKENLYSVMTDVFLDKLEGLGCKAIFYIEFVPVTEEGKTLAPDDEDRAYIKKNIARLRRKRRKMMYVSFPGDEKSSGGCLAAGRGFFHINSHGGAEPCPFSAYSDVNVKDTSLKEALASKLFSALNDGGVLKEDHGGGCVLFERKDRVEAILQQLSCDEKNKQVPEER